MSAFGMLLIGLGIGWFVGVLQGATFMIRLGKTAIQARIFVYGPQFIAETEQEKHNHFTPHFSQQYQEVRNGQSIQRQGE